MKKFTGVLARAADVLCMSKTSRRAPKILFELGLAAAFGCAVATPAWSNAAELPPLEVGRAQPELDAAAKQTSASAKGVVVYQPPRRGLPRKRIGGGVRGSQALRAPQALAPEHVGLTTQAAPSLFFHIDGPLDDDPASTVRFTLIEAEAIDPLVEIELDRPARAGIHRVRLSDYGVALEPDVEYQWTISIERDPNDRLADTVTRAFLMRVDEPRLAGRPRDSATLAELGLWYDAIEVVSDQIDAEPEERAQRDARAALLEAAGFVALETGS